MDTATKTALPTNGFAGKELEYARDLVAKHKAIRSEIGKVIVGQTYLVERLVIGLLANGHVLLEGVPEVLAIKSKICRSSARVG